jgi:collagenase-like PrtC family protease
MDAKGTKSSAHPASREAGLRYSIPFNGDWALLRRALASGQVIEVYFAAGPMDGKVWNLFGADPDASDDLGVDDARQLVELCHQQGVRANLLCNAPTLYFAGREALLALIREIAPDAVTISDPMAIAPLAAAFPDVDLQASLIMDLDSREKLRQALQRGVGTVTLPARFARDVRALAQVHELKAEFPRFRTKLIANMDCAYDCFLLSHHYMLGVLESVRATTDVRGPADDVYRCASCFNPTQSPQHFIRVPFIRPEDVGYYEQLGTVDALKLIYRCMPTPVLERVFRAYFERRYDGNLFDLIVEKRAVKDGPPRQMCDNTGFPEGFVQKVSRCDKDCTRCRYCEDVAVATCCSVA